MELSAERWTDYPDRDGATSTAVETESLGAIAVNLIMRACDDTERGPLTFRVAHCSRAVSADPPSRDGACGDRRHPAFEDGEMACGTYNVPVPDLYGVARYTPTTHQACRAVSYEVRLSLLELGA